MKQTCVNCISDFNGNFCSNCGHSGRVKRIDKHYVEHELLHLFHIERGFLYTAHQLFVRPGHTIKEYLAGQRFQHMKPIPFLIFASLIYTILIKLIGVYATIGQDYIKDLKDSIAGKMYTWVQTNYGYSNILMGSFVALFLYLFFKKQKYNFFEVLTMLCFIFGQGMLIYGFLSVLEKAFKIENWGYLDASLIMYLYCIVAITQFYYNGQKIITFLKVTIAYFLGGAIFYIGMMITGLLLDNCVTLYHRYF